LNKMVSDFLLLGRPITMNKKAFVVADLLSQIEVLCKQQLRAKNITIQAQNLDCVLSADEEQMRLVFINIILNAVEAAGEKGAIVCSAQKSSNPAALAITIADNGPGIEDENLERIFAPYFTQRPSGTGLGLALVRRIIEEHNGAIVAGNNPAGGAYFKFTIPQDAQ
ncbi:MAG: ATP-binding protein, partial [Chitinivibrionales bacterium]|nr:ATP-binding protein [Chitinivibrionales bacterium]